MAKRSKAKRSFSAPEQGRPARAKAFPWIIALQAAIIVVAALGIYSQALPGPWSWDDDLLITSNLRLHTFHGLAEIWFAPPVNDYWPLTWTLLWLEWHLWGNTPLPYHAVSLALHVASTFLLWRLFSRLGLRWAWFGALLFSIHPLVVESVAWAAEIKNTLSLPFFLLSCLAWLEAEEGKPRAYGKSLLYFLAAVLAKSSTVMLPMVLVLYCWWKRQKVTRAEWLRLAPYAAIALGLGLVTVYFQNQVYLQPTHHQVQPIDLGGPATRLARSGGILLFYLAKFLLPFGLVGIYPRAVLDYPGWIVTAGLAGVAALLFFGWQQRKDWGRHLLFGFGFFLINALPVLGLVKMKYFEFAWVADHLVYLPVIGLAGLVAAGFQELHDRFPAPLGRYSVATAGLIAALLAWGSWNYAALYADQPTFWTYVSRLNPTSYRAHNRLGLFYLGERRYEESMLEYQKALTINPDDAEAHDKIGLIYLNQQRYDECVQELEKALKIDPNDAEACNNTGICGLQTGQLTEAKEWFQRALTIDPAYAEAHANLGGLLLRQGSTQEAVDQFQQALRTAAENTNLRFELGAALCQLGQPSQAMEQFAEILRIDPNYPHIREAFAQAQAQAQAAQAKP